MHVRNSLTLHAGTGIAIGAFSLTWLVLFSVFILFSLAAFIILVLWWRGIFSALVENLILYRN